MPSSATVGSLVRQVERPRRQPPGQHADRGAPSAGPAAGRHSGVRRSRVAPLPQAPRGQRLHAGGQADNESRWPGSWLNPPMPVAASAASPRRPTMATSTRFRTFCDIMPPMMGRAMIQMACAAVPALGNTALEAARHARSSEDDRFARGREFDVRPALLGQLQIDAGGRQVNQLLSGIQGQVVLQLIAEVAQHFFVFATHPAGGMHVDVFKIASTLYSCLSR